MRVVVEGQPGEVLDEAIASESTLIPLLTKAALAYPQATLYVDGVQVKVQPEQKPPVTTTPNHLHDLQQQALSAMWGAVETQLRLAAQLREQDSALTARHLERNQQLIDAATAQREDHRKALKEIGMMERTQTVLQFDQSMDRQRWMQGMPAPRSAVLAKVGKSVLTLAMGAVEEGVRQMTAKGGTDGER